MTSDYSKENSFLINSLSGVLNGSLPCSDSINYGKLNWDYILSTADINGVIPLFSKSLNLYGKDTFPQEVFETLTVQGRESAVSNLVKLKEIFNITGRFKESGIKSLVLKGAGLGTDLYNDISLRPFGDLDLLVNKNNLTKAVDILRTCGYEHDFDYSEEQTELYKQSAFYLKDQDMHYSFYNDVKKIYLELHWALIPEKYSFSQDVDELFEEAVSISAGQGELQILSDEDNLIYLSLHGTKHFWSRLIWIADISMFLNKKENINWELVIAKSEELNCKRSLLLAVGMARKIFSTEPPAVFNSYLNKDKKLAGLINKAEKNYRTIYDIENIESENKTFFLNSMESLFDKMRFITDLIFKPRIYDIEFVKLPKIFSFLYYLIRPLRLFKKYFLKLISNN